jgi:hypothetical protein
LNFAIAAATDHGSRASSDFQRFVFALAAFAALPPLLLASFVIAVDPYYVFGSPSWPGFNAVRPYYEPRVVVAKPYQVWRQQPSAVALGSSRVEVGIDPRHGGWTNTNVFNFAMPSSNSYAVMLAFLHAQKVGAPLKQAVVGLDFFAYNIFFLLGSELIEARFADGISSEFAQFLNERFADRAKPPSRGPGAAARPTAVQPAWNEALYLAVNADVAAAIARKEFKSGREHYELAGRAEHREGAAVPKDWDEEGYLQVNPDVAYAISKGSFLSGYHHYLAAGRAERRLGGFEPAGWDEDRYLAANPSARNRVAQGTYRTGYLHYAAIGRSQGLPGGFAPAGILERLSLRWPALNKWAFKLGEMFRLVFSTTAVRDAFGTIVRQSEPATFDSLGTRVWQGHDEVLRRMGGPSGRLRERLAEGLWRPMLAPPAMMYCFTNPDTGMTMFDSFRFMLRRAHAEGTDLRLYVTPFHTAVRELFIALGLGERYEFWIKELVRINEEEAARANRPPFPLWDFSDPSAITSEPIPPAGDPSPMRWHWEFSHYRKETGDLILDRIFEHGSPARTPPGDFGVRLTGENVDTHLARSRVKLADWVAANPEVVSEILTAVRNPKAQTRQAEATCW